ncbi:glutathione-disulfide reductase [Dyella subtropica]|uniref:glutathione-disulfide reductase n=1 Tax=Dyella subtropica TaxID=2992127 RepID=UPI00225AC574|nr:glutathione-disulfide reductase [Dyella subtropica]
MADTYDLIVLGAGSGGLATSFRAARHGARVALLDPGALGGTCVNVGCVPKKALWFAAQLAQGQVLAEAYGFAGVQGPLDWEHFRQRRLSYIDGIKQRYESRLAEAGVQLLREAGRFVSADTIATTSGAELRAPQIVIATGARPQRLDVPGFELGLVSDDIFTLRELPRRIAVVGAGYIAVEFAGLLRALGSEVTLHVRQHLLRQFDAELVGALGQHMVEQGIRLAHQARIRAARRVEDAVVLEDEERGDCGPYDAVLWALGRVPNTERLDLDAAGVQVDAQGHVLVDAWQNTNVSGIAALGDVAGRRALTPVAVAAGRRLADRWFGGEEDARLDYDNIPSVVFSEPPLAAVGLSEVQAREQYGDQVQIHHSRFTPMQWALAGHKGQSAMKLVCVGEEQRVVGIHALGPGADEMLQGFAVALKMGLRKRDLDATVAIHPSSAEELVLMS